MGRSRMFWAAVLGGLGFVFVVESTGIGQAPRQGPPPEFGAASSPPAQLQPTQFQPTQLQPTQAQPTKPQPSGTPAANSAPAVTPMAMAEGMLGFASPDAAGGQMVTLIDSRQRWMAVYAVDAKGQIRLLSSRPLQQDFSVQYNVMDPTPAEIGRLKPR